ncbi:MAG: hypothetical protein MUP98_01750 [Candidatus Aminicenantes bacterium]|nr:hypothetical protein [Candidatus Aminicenantes bacterium]
MNLPKSPNHHVSASLFFASSTSGRPGSASIQLGREKQTIAYKIAQSVREDLTYAQINLDLPNDTYGKYLRMRID